MKPLKGTKLKNGTGAIVLAYKVAGYRDSWKNEGWIVLCVIPERGEFATWWMNSKGETYHGHYTTDLETGLNEFKERS